MKMNCLEAIISGILRPVITGFSYMIFYDVRKLKCCRKQKILKKCEEQIDERMDILNIIKKIEECETVVSVLKTNMNNTLMKFSGEKVIGSSSSEEEEESSGSRLEIEFEEIDKDEHLELMENTQK